MGFHKTFPSLLLHPGLTWNLPISALDLHAAESTTCKKFPERSSHSQCQLPPPSVGAIARIHLGVSCSPGWPQIHCVANNDSGLLILLPLPLMLWGSRWRPPHPRHLVFPMASACMSFFLRSSQRNLVRFIFLVPCH